MKWTQASSRSRLYGMFTVHYRSTLSLPQRDRIRWHLFPEVRVNAAQGSLDLADQSGKVELPDLMQVMDLAAGTESRERWAKGTA